MGAGDYPVVHMLWPRLVATEQGREMLVWLANIYGRARPSCRVVTWSVVTVLARATSTSPGALSRIEMRLSRVRGTS